MRRLLAVAALALANDEESSQQLQNWQYADQLIDAPLTETNFGVSTDPWLHRAGPIHREAIYRDPIIAPVTREVVRDPIYDRAWNHEEYIPLHDGMWRGRERVIAEPVIDERWRGVEEVYVDPIYRAGPAAIVEDIPGNIDTIAIREPFEDAILYPEPVIARPNSGAQFKYEQFPVWSKKPHKFADFYCPKPGFVMTTDNECCREARCESRLECPWGFAFDGTGCFQYYDPTVFCPRGTLYDGVCRIVRSIEPIYECPANSELDIEGNCSVWEQYTPIEVCPHATIRSKNGCLAVEYTEPALVCPPDTTPDGKKCRREIVTLKMKKEKVEKRRLQEEEGETDELFGEALEEYEPTADELEAMGKEGALAYDDLYADIAVGGVVECDSADCFEEWLPATSEFKIKTKKVKQPIVSEQLKWEKIKIPVTTAKVKDIKVKVPEVKVKLPKEKNVKSPHEVIKVVTQAAEKVCPIGVKHGSTCVAETIVPPVFECPHPQLGPDCARKIVVPPTAICTTGEVACDAFGCRCESYTFSPPEVTCAGGHQLINGRCVIAAEWQRMCPIGYFLEADGVTCAKIDCEPPLTVVAKPLSPKKKLPKKLMEAEEEEGEWEE